MLSSLDDIKELFVCPASQQPLKQTAEGTFETDDGCFQYEMADGFPVLVDFNRSVLRQQDVMASGAASPVQRLSYPGLVGRTLRRLISPPNRMTRTNVDLLLSDLRANASEKHVLVIGGGAIGKGMEPLYAAEDIRISAFDIYASENVQLIADAHQIPFKDATFDAIVIQAVLEHVLIPQNVVNEIHRVLRMGGIIYAETPFLQQVHEGAYDFTRFTESGHRYLFKDFDLVRSGALGGPGKQMLWSIDYLVRSVFRSWTLGKLARVVMFWVQYLDLIIPDRYKVDSASGVYFMGRKNGTTIAPFDIIRHYSGAYPSSSG